MYSYKEKRAAALAENATAKDRIALFFWMENYARSEWNGERFNIDEGLSLYPVYNVTYDEDGEIEELEVVDAEIR